MKRNKAFTLLELIVVISIVLIMSTGLLFGIRQSQYKKDYKLLTKDFPEYMNMIALQSDLSDSIYNFEFNFIEKLILIKKDGNIISDFELPKSFEYEDKNGSKIITGKTTVNGNINQSFVMYSFNKEKPIFRQSFVSNKKYIQFLYIINYEPKSSIAKGEHTNYYKWEKIE